MQNALRALVFLQAFAFIASKRMSFIPSRHIECQQGCCLLFLLDVFLHAFLMWLLGVFPFSTFWLLISIFLLP